MTTKNLGNIATRWAAYVDGESEVQHRVSGRYTSKVSTSNSLTGCLVGRQQSRLAQRSGPTALDALGSPAEIVSRELAGTYSELGAECEIAFLRYDEKVSVRIVKCPGIGEVGVKGST